MVYQETTLPNGAVVATWSALTEADTNPPTFKCPPAAGKSVHVKGTFNGGTVILRGNNFPGAAVPATNPLLRRAHDGDPIEFTVEGGAEFLENFAEVYPIVSVGSGVSVDVAIVAIPLYKW